MAAAKKIAAYLDPIHLTRQFEILNGISDYARARGTLSLGPRPATSLLYTEFQVRNWSGDGIIGVFYDAPLVDSLQQRGIVVLNLTEQLSPRVMPVVVTDNWIVGQLAAAHLLERGYRRFGYIGEHLAHFSRQRQEGFERELKKNGINASAFWNADLPHRDALSPEWLMIQIGELIGPIGILALDDDAASSTVIAAQANGLRVPQDLAVVGVNDLELVCYSAPVALSSIAPAYLKIGLEAARLLDRLLQGQAAADTIIRVPPAGLVERLSTRFLAFEDPLVERALAYMHANVNQRYNVDDLVRHCGKSRRTLELRFTQHIGHSVLEEINRLRVQRARQLLTDTEWTIARVAEECGFGDSKLMIRVFQRVLGKTPRAVRGQADGPVPTDE
jgi:LacI family transcriptional regulator